MKIRLPYYKHFLKYFFYFGALSLCLVGVIAGIIIHDYRMVLISSMFSLGLVHFGQTVLRISQIEEKHDSDSEEIRRRLDELKLIIVNVREKIENGAWY